MFSWFRKYLFRAKPDKSARPANNNAKALGDEGETVAAHFLEKQCGLKILVRNWRSPKDRRDEIDLICKEGDVLVFVEVKTYPTARLLNGYEAVDARKKAVIKRAASVYLRSLGTRGYEMPYRLDVVVIERTEYGKWLPHHFQNVAMN